MLVTGGVGYIGSAVVGALLDQGYAVVVLDRHEGAVGSLGSRVTQVVADVADMDAVRAAIRNHSVSSVVHLAGLSIVSDSMRDPPKYLEANAAATMRLLQVMQEERVAKLVFSSSAAVYGNADEIPIPEEHPVRPTSAYGLSKLIIEESLAWAERAWGLRSVSLRYFNAAGAIPEWKVWENHRPETHLIPRLLRHIREGTSCEVMGTDYPTADGTAIRDYVHVGDVADAHVRSLSLLDNGGQGVFNIGSGRGYSVREVIEALGKVTGQKISVVDCPRRAGDPPVLIAKIDMAKRVLGWIPQRSTLDAILTSVLH